MVLRKILKKLKDEFSYTKKTLKSILIKHGHTTKYIKFTSQKAKENIAEEIQMEEITKVKELGSAEELKFPILNDKNFDSFLQKFMHSYREKEHPTINLNNLLFLNGSEKVGKSWFLRKNLKNFDEVKGNIKNLAVHYDIREVENSNFQSFLINFERSIIDSIINRNKYEFHFHKKTILNQKDLLDLLFFRWEKGWIEINLSKSLKRAISETENPYTYTINKGDNYNEILELLQKYEKKALKDYPLIEKFERFVEIIEKDMNISNLEASIILIYDCLIQKEDFRKPEKIFENELYRDGLDVMEYFFDILNFIAGYHESHNKKTELGNVDSLKMIYPHVCLAIESVQELFEMKDSERRPSDYMHRMILRLYNNKGYRDHFPVIFETNKNYYFDKIIYDELFDHKWTYPTLLFEPLQYMNELDQVLDKMLNNFQKEIFLRFLQKSSVYNYKYLIEMIKSKGFQNFEDVFHLNHEIPQKEFLRFAYKINKVYLHPGCADILDNGEIDHNIVDIMREWYYLFVHNLDPYISIRRNAYDFSFFNKPVIRAFLDENIIIFNKYTRKVYLQNYIFNFFNNSLYNFFNKNKFGYFGYIYHHFYYRFFKAFKFESDFYTIGRRKTIFRLSLRPWEWTSNQFIHGYNLKWDVPMELYKGDYRKTYYYEQVIPTKRIL